MSILDFFKRLIGAKKQSHSNMDSGNLINNPSEKVMDQPNITVRTNDNIDVKERIKEINPSKAGLYPHEVLLLYYAPSYYIDDQTFQGFWWYRYGVIELKQSLTDLLDRGYLKVGSLQSAIEKETVVTLKDVLRENNLKVSGKKAELVERLLTAVPAEQLKHHFNQYTYQLTDRGEEALNQAEYIPYIHRNNIDGLDIYTLTKKIQETPGAPYRDIIWSHFNERSDEYMKNNRFGLYRNERLSMSDFLQEEGKHEEAFALLAEVIRYDLSGLSNGFNMEFLTIYAEHYFPYSHSLIKMAPGITRKVIEYQNQFELSNVDLKNKLADTMEKIRLPFSVFTVDEKIRSEEHTSEL